MIASIDRTFWFLIPKGFPDILLLLKTFARHLSPPAFFAR